MTQIDKLMTEILEKEAAMMDLTAKKRRLILDDSSPPTSIVSTSLNQDSGYQLPLCLPNLF